MRRHGWQLPYHPLQVVATAVFLALAFAFYVFFLPFVGKKLYQFVLMGIYTPLVTCVFFLYVWCAATDPGDPGVFKSKKYLNHKSSGKQAQLKESAGGSTNITNAVVDGNKPSTKGIAMDNTVKKLSNVLESDKSSSSSKLNVLEILFGWCPLLRRQHHSHEDNSMQQSEEGMFYCSLCEVEVLKQSKHCRVCDKCVDNFDHHCRWLNNCIGRKNYFRFFILMISALLLLILQWSVGILVLILCFLERKRFSVEIVSKLGSSFSVVPFVVVVASCTLLAMVATLPLAQLFFFHVLLIKKGISTYDYIIALREQEQLEIGGQQSPQMSQMSSLTGLSSTSSFNTFHRAAWCTPPRLFLEDQFDVVHPEAGTSSSYTAKKVPEEPTKKPTARAVKISSWALARMNAEEVSKVAAQARKKSKILHPVIRREISMGQDAGSSSSFNSDHNRSNKKSKPILDIVPEPLSRISASGTDSNISELTAEASTSLAPLQREARSAFRTSRVISSTGIIASSPDSSLGSPDVHLHPFRTSTGAEESVGLVPLPASGSGSQKGINLSRSTSDGYDASGGEDSDRVPSKIVPRSSNWNKLLLRSDIPDRSKAASSCTHQSKTRKIG